MSNSGETISILSDSISLNHIPRCKAVMNSIFWNNLKSRFSEEEGYLFLIKWIYFSIDK